MKKNHFELYDKFIPMFRVLMVAALIAITFFRYPNGFFKDLSHNLFLIVYFAYAVFLLFFKKIRKKLMFKYPVVMGIFEMLIITYGVACTGGSASPFYLLYLIVIAFFAIVYNFKYTALVCCFAAVFYTGAVLLAGRMLLFDYIEKMLFLFLFACFTGVLNERLNKFDVRMAIYDNLTTLFNRQYFYGEFENVLVRCLKEKVIVSMVVIDIDNFKSINDLTGHLAGDRILSEIGTLIRGNIREGDLAARYGGDEFVIVFPNTSTKDASAICERLKNNIREYFEGKVSVSIGYASFPNDGISSNDLFHVADLDMYRAKAIKKAL